MKIEHVILAFAIVLYTLLVIILTSSIFIFVGEINTPKYYITLILLWIGIIKFNLKSDE